MITGELTMSSECVKRWNMLLSLHDMNLVLQKDAFIRDLIEASLPAVWAASVWEPVKANSNHVYYRVIISN